MRWIQILSQSLDAIRVNLFRAGITIFIIALGIASLVGVLTSIEGIKYSMVQSFSSLGSNTVRIRNRASLVQFGHRGKRAKRHPSITYRQASEFKEAFGESTPVSLMVTGSGMATVRHLKRETNANIQFSGSDENYMVTARYSLAEGRMISGEDVELGRKVIVLGSGVYDKIFPTESAVGQSVTINGKMYRVIGTFESMGSAGSSGGDKVAIAPITALRSVYSSLGSYTINLYVENAMDIPMRIEEARGTFRLIRKLRLRDQDNFDVSKADAFVDQIIEKLSLLTTSAKVIAFITLLGSSVALLNVMLVSVTERQFEIGLRKAMGATKKNIMNQFLAEAIVICQIGGVFGVLLGLLVGNVLGVFVLKGGFVVPWAWIVIGLVACFVVGVASGIYPARKAAQVDPIASLRSA